MKTMIPLTAIAGLLALSACGEETSADAQSPGQERQVEAPVKATEPVAVAKAEPVAEPIDAIITFRGEDGELELERAALTMVSPVHDAENDVWSVFVQLDKKAAEDFYTLTTKTTGEALSIVVDEMVVGAPVLENPVFGGGFVFDVDDGKVASTVVAALTGEEPTVSAPVEIAAGDALETDGEASDAVESAQADEE